MQYSFDVQEAIDYGVNEAIMIWNLRFWIIKNKANNKHFYNGKTWTYNSHEAFAKLFPFWTERQINHLLKKLVDAKVIDKNNFNATKYNRTVWYSFFDESKFLSANALISHITNLSNGDDNSVISSSQKSNIDITNLENGDDKNAISNTNIKPNIKLTLSEVENFTNEILRERNFTIDVKKFYSWCVDEGKLKTSWKNILKKWVEKKENQILKATEKKEESELKKRIKHALSGIINESFYLIHFKDAEEKENVIYVKSKEALRYVAELEKINVKIEVR